MRLLAPGRRNGRALAELPAQDLLPALRPYQVAGANWLVLSACRGDDAEMPPNGPTDPLTPTRLAGSHPVLSCPASQELAEWPSGP